MTAAWARLMAASEAMQRSRLLHLHHLTPLHDAAARVLPRVPVLTHLHGTELKMLDAIARESSAVAQGPHARWWASRAQGGGTSGHRHHHHLALRARPTRCACSGSTRPPCTACRTASTSSGSRRTARATTSAASSGSSGSCAIRRAGTRRPASAGSVATPSGRCSMPSSTPRPASAGPVLLFVGRFLGFKRAAAAGPRVRPRAGADGEPRAARHLGRRARRVGGGAPAHRRDARGRRGRVLQRLARPRRAADRARLRRLSSSRRPPTSRSGSSTWRRWPASCP